MGVGVCHRADLHRLRRDRPHRHHHRHLHQVRGHPPRQGVRKRTQLRHSGKPRAVTYVLLYFGLITCIMFQFISLNYDIKPCAVTFVLLDLVLTTLTIFQFISLEFSLNYDIKPHLVTLDLLDFWPNYTYSVLIHCVRNKLKIPK